MPSNFPTAPDNIANNVANSTPEADVHPNLHNQLADAVNAVETALLTGGSMNLAAHVAAADPHAVYLTQPEGDARYSAIGGGAVVADGSITLAKLAGNSVDSSKIVDGTVAAVDMAAGAAAANVGTLGGSLSGTLPNPTLAANSVGASQITDGTVGTAELADGGVTSAKIADGTIATVDLKDGAVTNAKLASDTARANLLCNGSFEIWQRGPGPFTTAFAADRWTVYAGGGALSVSKDTTNMDLASFTCAACTVTGAVSVANAAILYQYPATVGDNGAIAQFRGKTVSFSVRVKATVASACRLALISNGGSTTYSSYHSGGGQYETLTVSGVVANNSTGIGITTQVQFEAAGTYYIDNAMLVVGSVPADYAPLHPADDLARCLRYYEMTPADQGQSLRATGIATAGAQVISCAVQYKARKAVTPTATKVGTWLVSNTPQPIANTPGVDGLSLEITSSAAGAFYAISQAGAYLTLEANP